MRENAFDSAGLEEKIGYSFRNKDFLAEALTHKSYYHEHPGEAAAHNERLEFLGDSVLGMAVVDFLFKLENMYDESTMSKIKSYVVKKAVLSDMAAELSLGSYLRVGKGEEDTGGRNKSSILSDAMEAVIGAVYCDAGFEAARDFVIRLFRKRIEKAVRSGNYHDYKTELQEKCQNIFGVLPDYRLIAEEGQEHEKLFTIEVYIQGERRGSGTGGSKKEAQQAAAREALSSLSL